MNRNCYAEGSTHDLIPQQSSPTFGEVKKAIEQMKSDKASGKDVIQLKLSKDNLIASFTRSASISGIQEIPSDFRDAITVIRYHNHHLQERRPFKKGDHSRKETIQERRPFKKGNHSHCEYYRGIALCCPPLVTFLQVSFSIIAMRIHAAQPTW